MPWIPARDELDFGIGVDGLTLNKRGKSLQKSEITKPIESIGARITFISDLIENRESLGKSLGVTGDLGVSIPGIVQASDKLTFFERSTFNEYSLFILVGVVVNNATLSLEVEELTDDAKSLLVAGKEEEFRVRYGDSFVQQKITGGEFYAILEIETRSESDRQNISNNLDVSAILDVVGLNLGGGVDSETSKLLQHRQMKVAGYIAGGERDIPSKPEEIVKKWKAFSTEVAGDKAVTFQVFIQDYKTLTLPEQPNWINIENARQVLQNIGERRSYFLTIVGNIDFIQSHREQFEEFDPGTLIELRSKVTKHINLLTKAASACIDNITEAKFPEDEEPLVALPKRKDIVVIVGDQHAALHQSLLTDIGALSLRVEELENFRKDMVERLNILSNQLTAARNELNTEVNNLSGRADQLTTEVNTLNAGPGKGWLYSENKKYVLSMQGDGNAVTYLASGPWFSVWSSGGPPPGWENNPHDMG